MSKIKERPIIFNGAMVRAILDGKKTMTRRVVKPQIPDTYKWSGWVLCSTDRRCEGKASWVNAGGYKPIYCRPYCKIGDRLWVRETHAQVLEVDIPKGRSVGPIGTVGSPARPNWKSRYIYKADGDMPNVQWKYVGDSSPVYWTPSIHMPRHASRILLEVTGVRVERLQDITDADSVSEGIPSEEEYLDDNYPHPESYADADYSICPRCGGTLLYTRFVDGGAMFDQDCDLCYAAKKRFEHLWDSLYAKRGYDWDTNPWVWVIEFRRIKP